MDENLQAALDDAQSHDNSAAVEARRTAGGELIIWKPEIKSSLRPMATLGTFKNGEPSLHLRTYRVRPNGVACMTRAGCSFRLDEFVEVVERLRAVFDVIPSLRGEGR